MSRASVAAPPAKPKSHNGQGPAPAPRDPRLFYAEAVSIAGNLAMIRAGLNVLVDLDNSAGFDTRSKGEREALGTFVLEALRPLVVGAEKWTDRMIEGFKALTPPAALPPVAQGGPR